MLVGTVVLMRTYFEFTERGKLGCIEHGTLAPCTPGPGTWDRRFSQYIRVWKRNNKI